MYVNVKDDNILSSMNNVLSEMNNIRDDVIKNYENSYVNNDDYLHLTYELASMIEEVVLKNNDLRMLINTINYEIEKDETLLSYDPFQEEYWINEKKDFINYLNKCSVFFVKNINFNNEKHHLFQAVKYLGSRSLSDEERMKRLGSISPFIGGLQKNTNNYCYDLEDYLTGIDKNKNIFYLNPFTVLIKKSMSNPDKEACSIAKKYGFLRAKISTSHNYYSDDLRLENSTSKKRVYVVECRDSKKKYFLEDLFSFYEKHGITANNILTEHVYKKNMIPKSCDKKKELEKIKIFDKEEKTINDLFEKNNNKLYKIPVHKSKNHSSISENLLITNSRLMYYLTTHDGEELSGKKLNKLCYLLLNNNDMGFLRKRLLKTFKEHLIYSKMYNLTNKGIELIDENTYV